MKIEVKRSHIKNGVPSDPFSCPVSLALTAKTKIEFYVDGSTIRDEGEDLTEYVVPKKVARFIECFDASEYEPEFLKRCKPFSFVLKKKRK